jgi:uncharacterized protein YfaS (alpha-2-macroglobulin family)
MVAAPRDDQWKKVKEAQDKGLPRTAIEHLQPIIDGAMKDKNYPEAIKAIGLKISLEGNIQGNKPEEKITRMQAEIAKAPKEMVPVMDAILAHWYWHYFQQNRYRFVRRTQTAEPPGKDIQTWDLARILTEIDKQFTKALSAEQELKNTPIGAYDALIAKGTVSDNYRPTLYDFIVFDALNFYVTGEQAGAKASDAFELTATSPIFATVDDFMKWDVPAADADSRIVKALKLYQTVLRFHKNDKDPTAFNDADLGRLVFGHNKAVGEEKNAAYKMALKAFADKNAKHELSAVAKARWAGVLQSEQDLVSAREIASEGLKAFPNSVGGKQCYNIIQQIEAKSSQVSIERVWNGTPLPEINVRYRNLNKAYFRLVKSDWVARLNRNAWRPEGIDQNDQKALVAQKPEYSWNVDLPETKDYKEKVEKIAPPSNVKPGFYFLISSHNAEFSDAKNQVGITDCWVSNLSIITRHHNGGKLEGFVLDAATGEPIADAQIQSWHHTFNNNRWNESGKGTTDKDGRYSIPGANQQAYAVMATHKDQQLVVANDIWLYNNNFVPPPHEQTIFFTDRSLYRPGQTINYKGLAIRVDTEGDNYNTVANRTMTVIFSDVNYKEITRQTVTSNEYGSFSGSFTAPRDRLMGRMQIHSQQAGHGAVAINVEEYKRPKFQVAMELPKTAPKLNAEVLVPGKATAYTGAAINNAQVKFRVVREVRYPDWWGWRYWWRQPAQPSQEIAHGTTTTEADGTFQVQFNAKPDATVAEKEEPSFRYTITADVVDSTGETRVGTRTVTVGYTALQAGMKAEAWQTDAKPVDIKVSTTTLDGEGQAARTQLKVYALKQPEKVAKAKLHNPWQYWSPRAFKNGKEVIPDPDPADVNSWALGDMVSSMDVATSEKGEATASVKLAPGIYRAMLETKDRFGKAVTAQLPLEVVKPDAAALNIKVPNLVAAPKWSLEPGEQFTALWGTGYDRGRAFVEVEHRGKILQSYWTAADKTQTLVKQAVDESMRGGFTLRVTMVRENRAYLTSHKVEVPWTNKNLNVKWEHFTSKLEPGKKETFTAVITGPDAKRAAAEVVAGMYDASLDAYLPHNWRSSFGVFRQDYSRASYQFENMMKTPGSIMGYFPVDNKPIDITYRHFPHELTVNSWGYGYFNEGGMPGGFGGRGGANRLRQAMEQDGAAMAPAMANMAAAKGAAAGDEKAEGLSERSLKKRAANGAEVPDAQPEPDLSNVSARKNLNETAFFFPHLISNAEGVVKLEFTMPEALTEWKFMAFAHDSQLRGGYLQDKVVTAKDLMVQPNAPRFVREADVLEFTVKVSNQSEVAQKGTVRLTFADARTGKNVDSDLQNLKPDLGFDLAAKESKSLSWKLTIPDGIGPMVYKAVGSAAKVSDGEEGFLPSLSRRVLVTESMALPIRGKQTKQFDFRKLEDSGKSDTIQNQSYTVQMVSQPAWYAVMALPYLMESQYECTEQTFNRLYANAVARHIAVSDPKIRRIFDQWKNTPTLDSPLEKNQDLKSVLLEETPWVRQAEKESQARKNVGILFDDNRLTQETANLVSKMASMQHGDGMWPWFPGGRGNEYITLYITTGYGRLRNMDIKVDAAAGIRAVTALDAWVDRIYHEILKKPEDVEKNHLSPTIALYLYGRSFFLKDKPVADAHKKAVDYFIGQAQKYWLQLANRQSQAHLALALKRWGDKTTPMDIMKSIKERSLNEEEMGRYWRDLERSHWWFRAPIETQALMIEAFHEIMDDATAVEDCKVWLLKQKQTQDWKTTKATADAVYGLLIRGNNLLSSDALVEVKLGGVAVKPEKVEAGTGFYEQKFIRNEVKPEMGKIELKKTDDGVSWGSVHWQYLEDIGKVTPHTDNPLKLTKTLWTKKYTNKGPVLEAMKGPAAPGDELVVRVELRTDRDMEYVHLKDGRGSGTEPVNVLSRYKYQDGLGYYETTRDTASHFFIDYLPKGVYVFEYSLRVVHKGSYQTGMAEIQCMYAPEFNSHSESLPLEVR